MQHDVSRFHIENIQVKLTGSYPDEIKRKSKPCFVSELRFQCSSMHRSPAPQMEYYDVNCAQYLRLVDR